MVRTGEVGISSVKGYQTGRETKTKGKDVAFGLLHICQVCTRCDLLYIS